MNYRHLYHAGNFADVFKHVILTLLIQALQKKATPFMYLDTHAGIGRYDLTTALAQQTAEFQEGIIKLWEVSEAPPAVATYLNLVRQFNQINQTAPTSKLRFYPGSPCLVKMLLRETDRMILCELHPGEVQTLRRVFAQDQQVVIQQQDGYQALTAYLPPPQKRGLVLIDPPFEQLTEFKAVMVGLTAAYRRWATGIYAVWYPIKQRAVVKQFYQQLARSPLRQILVAELLIYPDDTSTLGLNGAGLVIVNPPWQLDEQLQTLLPWLRQHLAIDHQGSYQVKWFNT